MTNAIRSAVDSWRLHDNSANQAAPSMVQKTHSICELVLRLYIRPALMDSNINTGPIFKNVGLTQMPLLL